MLDKYRWTLENRSEVGDKGDGDMLNLRVMPEPCLSVIPGECIACFVQPEFRRVTGTRVIVADNDFDLAIILSSCAFLERHCDHSLGATPPA